MAHEPECWLSRPDAPEYAKRYNEDCECHTVRAAYQRGREEAANRVLKYMRDTYGGSITVEEDRIIALIRGEEWMTGQDPQHLTPTAAHSVPSPDCCYRGCDNCDTYKNQAPKKESKE